ncbi:bifunctional metallophosphatase/5'-nucleotidase [Deinococcus yunweiensis]|uniref:bifunctional metallophosphatase/5'-nucleotidase n=1 Tax=Deinococcus yunweiensis TaxID=367282 RepID=UPI00398E6786
MPELTILHTNDIHGHLSALARLTTVARREHAQALADGRTVFRWDGGDAIDRRFEPCRLTRGASLPPVLAASGVTLQAVGNDIGLPYGMLALTQVAARAAYPMLAANLRDGSGPVVEGIHESVLLDAPDGTRIGVFGLTDPWNGVYRVYGLNMPDEQEVAARLVTELRDAGAGLVVLLSHLGLDADRRMAAVSGIDLIVGAHSHDLLSQGEWVGHTLIVQAGNYAEHLGRLDVSTDADGRLVSAVAHVIPIPADAPEDAAVLRAMDDLNVELDGIRGQVIGEVDGPLTLDHFGVSPVAQVAAVALRERAGAEVGLIGSGAFHTGLAAGPVTFGALADALPVTVNPLVSRVSGAALWRALERGVDPDVVAFRLRGLRGSPIGVPAVAGASVHVDPNAESGQRVTAVTVSGEPLDPARLYTVAHTDLDNEEFSYLYGDGVTLLGSDYSVLVEDVLREYLQTHSPVGTPEVAWHGLTPT